MSGAARVLLGEGCFIVEAPDGRQMRFRRHDQALDYAADVLREQARLRDVNDRLVGGYRVRKSAMNSNWEVVDRAGRVVGSVTTKELALNKVDALVRQARLRRRPCLTCGTVFQSEGAHNRLCLSCRGRSAVDVAV